MKNKILRGKIIGMYLLGTCITLPAFGQVAPEPAKTAGESHVSREGTEIYDGLLRRMETATSVKVVLEDMYEPTVLSMIDMPDVPRRCTYTTEDPQLIAELVETIRKDVVPVKSRPPVLDGREAIIFNVANGYIHVDLSGAVGAPPVGGYVTAGGNSGVWVQANPSVIRTLYQWSHEAEPLKYCSHVDKYLYGPWYVLKPLAALALLMLILFVLVKRLRRSKPG